MHLLPPPPTSRKARSTYDSLLAAVQGGIRTTGGVSPEEVTAAATVSTATFYTYFRSKDHAVAAAFDLSLGTLMDEVAGLLTMDRVLDEGLEPTVRRVVAVVIDSFRTDARIYRLALSRLSESELVRGVYVAREHEILGYLTVFFTRGITAGMVRDDDPALLARVALVSFQGLMNPALLRHGSPELERELASMIVGVLSPEGR